MAEPVKSDSHVVGLFDGHVYTLDLTGKIVGCFGKSGKDVGEIQNWRLQRLILEPPAATQASR